MVDCFSRSQICRLHKGHETVTPPPGHTVTVKRRIANSGDLFVVFIPSAMPKVVSRAAVSTSQDGPYQLPSEDMPVSDPVYPSQVHSLVSRKLPRLL
jgi:hypothetical protein